jgi:hypothetical protein
MKNNSVCVYVCSSITVTVSMSIILGINVGEVFMVIMLQYIQDTFHITLQKMSRLIQK